MAGNACWPMFEDSVKPKIARACVGGREERYGVHGDALLDANHVAVQLAHVTHIAENEGLRVRSRKKEHSLGIEPAGDDVLRVLATHLHALIQSQRLPQELLVVRQLDHQGALEHVLQPLGEEEGNQVTQMKTARRRTSAHYALQYALPSRVEIELLSLLVRVQDQVEISMRHPASRRIPVAEEHSTAHPLVHLVARYLLKTRSQLLCPLCL